MSKTGSLEKWEARGKVGPQGHDLTWGAPRLIVMMLSPQPCGDDGMAKKQKWIQKAVKRPGDLTRWAKRHGIQPPFSQSDLMRLRSIAMKLPAPLRTRRLRQINFARTMKRIRSKRNK